MNNPIEESLECCSLITTLCIPGCLSGISLAQGTNGSWRVVIDRKPFTGSTLREALSGASKSVMENYNG